MKSLRRLIRPCTLHPSSQLWCNGTMEYLLLRHGPNVLSLIVNQYQCYVEFDYF